MPAHLIPPDDEKIPERARSGQHTYLGTFDVVPTHRYLNHPKSVDACNHQIFHIEIESLQPLAGKDDPRDVLAEQLESALGVAKTAVPWSCASPC